MAETKKPPIHVVNEGDPNEAIAPITVGNPRKASDLAISQEHLEEYAMSEEGPNEVSCARPAKGIYFAVYPETGKVWQNRRFFFLLEVPNRDPFLVAPAIAKQKKEEGEDTIRPVLIVRYVTMGGDEGLWALKLDPPDGKSNAWNRSAKTVLKVADEGKWVRMLSGKGQYRYTVSPKTFEQTPPKHSSRSYDELISSAFPPEQCAFTTEHEIWTILAEGSEK
jgi:hypothetical protein